MPRKSFVLLAASAFLFGGWALVRAQSSAPAGQPAAVTHAQPAADIPAYHAHPPQGLLPATIDPAEFSDALNQNVYRLAGNPKLKRILYQQPCCCHCDREVGHKSLLDCYVDRHASICAVCKAEAIYAYEQSRKGKTAAQIRRGILAGDWRTVNLYKYGLPSTPN